MFQLVIQRIISSIVHYVYISKDTKTLYIDLTIIARLPENLFVELKMYWF